MHRLFVGFRPPAAIRAQALAIMGGVPGARWQSEAQLHVTLRFVGAVEPRKAEDIAVGLCSLRFPATILRLAGIGIFEQRARTHALWTGVSPREPLVALHRKIDQLLVRCGLPSEHRAYLPHLTLARMSSAPVAAAEPFLAMHGAFASAPFALDHFLLIESHLGRERAAYEVVQRYPAAYGPGAGAG